MAASTLLAGQVMNTQTLDKQAAEAVVETIVPAMLDQLKYFGGSDVMNLMAGETSIENTSVDRLYTLKVDSVLLNLPELLHQNGKEELVASLTGIVKSMGFSTTAMPIYFSDYKAISNTKAPLEVQIPQKIVCKAKGGGLTLNVEVEPADKNTDDHAFGLGKLKIDMELDGMLASIASTMGSGSLNISGLENGTVVDMTQTTTNGITTVECQFGPLAVSLMSLIKPSYTGLHGMKTVYDPVTRKDDDITLLNVYNDMGEGFKLTQECLVYSFEGYNTSDSTLTTIYNPASGEVMQYAKKVRETGSTTDLSDGLYQTKKYYMKSNLADDWGEAYEKDSTTYYSIGEIDPDDILKSLLSTVNSAIELGQVPNLPVYQKQTFHWETGDTDYKAQKATRLTLGFDDDSKDDFPISFTLQNQIATYDDKGNYEWKLKNEFVAGFSDEESSIALLKGPEDDDMAMITVFFQSNLPDGASIQLLEHAIEVKGLASSAYTIFNMQGKAVKQGLIAADNDQISLQGLSHGAYILTVNGQQTKSLKFIH